VIGTALNPVFVACSRDDSITTSGDAFLRHVVRRLVGYGIIEVAVPELWKKSSEWERLHTASQHKFVIGRALNERDSFENQLRVPRITCLLDKELSPIPEFISMLNRPLHIVFVWADSPHRDFAGKKFFDYTPRTNLSDFLRRLQQ
jgi:hypothetical protein